MQGRSVLARGIRRFALAAPLLVASGGVVAAHGSGATDSTTGTTFTSRYAWNISADTGVGGTHGTSGTAFHHIGFTVTRAV